MTGNQRFALWIAAIVCFSLAIGQGWMWATVPIINCQ